MKPETKPILEVRNITKQFPGVKALDNVSMAFYPGEVHAVMGENGAGKSTLMKILVGAYLADKGDIFFKGEKAFFRHPKEAQEAGISIIYQEFNLLSERTVAQNIFLGREPTRYNLIDEQKLEEQTWAVLEQIDAKHIIQPSTLVKNLSIANQQIVEIAKAISFDAQVLIMDEPTAALATNEAEILFDLVRKLQAQGIALIFISHRFAEVFEISQKITVLKDGVKVDTVAAEKVSTGDVIKMMVGRELDQYYPPLANLDDMGEVVLEVKNGSNHFLKDINLKLRAGEIVGLAGLQGSGRTETAQALFGVEPFKTGTITLKGKQMTIKSPATAIKHGLGFVTEDRKAEGILPNQPLRDNMLITIRSLRNLFARIWKNGLPNQPLVPQLAERVDVRAANYDQEIQYLSGGNQQKVVLAKWLATSAEILIFDEPTRGIDVDAKANIHKMIRELARGGTAILMISSELPEIIGMSDRIVVMWDGRISGELSAASSETDIMAYATGVTNDSNN